MYNKYNSIKFIDKLAWSHIIDQMHKGNLYKLLLRRGAVIDDWCSSFSMFHNIKRCMLNIEISTLLGKKVYEKYIADMYLGNGYISIDNLTFPTLSSSYIPRNYLYNFAKKDFLININFNLSDLLISKKKKKDSKGRKINSIFYDESNFISNEKEVRKPRGATGNYIWNI